ncbi:response regulator [Pseudomonas syringae pv. actinidiae]|nr:response regulator [Pseudomonas syringae pv. actinidiae]
MCLYLPRHYLGAPEEIETVAGVSPPVQTERTIMIVDDERPFVCWLPKSSKTRVISPSRRERGASALRVLESDVRIDLLVTDVGLPGGMNGRQLADAARIIRPDLKVLFITGYAENAIIGNGHLVPGMWVLTKPFTMEAFASRIYEMIERDD